MVMKSRGGGQPEAGEGSTLESRASSGENDGDMLTIRRARDAPMALSLASRRSSYAPPRVQDTPTRREGDRSVKHGHRNREVCILPSRHSRDKSCRRGRDVSRTATNKTRRSDGTRAVTRRPAHLHSVCAFPFATCFKEALALHQHLGPCVHAGRPLGVLLCCLPIKCNRRIV